jgi:hypothetical protein
MKYITLIIGLLVMGCCTPVKELTLREKVVGAYERKEDGETKRLVLLENGGTPVLQWNKVPHLQ